MPFHLLPFGGAPEALPPATPPSSPAPTPEEARNGWTRDALAAYLKEREAAAAARVLGPERAAPARADGAHDPHTWRP
jgi:hypothetical protein